MSYIKTFEVEAISSQGFIIKNEQHIKAPVSDVRRTLTQQIDAFWLKDHGMVGR